MDPDPSCHTCRRDIRKLQQVLTCSMCQNTFHRTCVKEVDQEAYRRMKRDKSILAWTCLQCDGALPTPAAPTVTLATAPAIPTPASLPVTKPTVPPLTTPAASLLQEMGFSKESIREAILAVRRQTGCNLVSTEEALSHILDHAEGANTLAAAPAITHEGATGGGSEAAVTTASVRTITSEASSVRVAGGGSVFTAPVRTEVSSVGVAGGGTAFTAPVRTEASSVRVASGGSVFTAPVRTEAASVGVASGGSVFTTPVRTETSSVGVASEGSVFTAPVRTETSSVGVASEGSVFTAPVRTEVSSVGVAGGGTAFTAPVRTEASSVRVASGGSMFTAPVRTEASSVRVAGGGSVFTAPVRTEASSVRVASEGSVFTAPVRTETSSVGVAGGGSVFTAAVRTEASSVRVASGGTETTVPVHIAETSTVGVASGETLSETAVVRQPDVPGQPRLLVHDCVTSSSVTLDWLAPINSTPNCEYIIEKVPVPGLHWLQTNNAPVRCTRYTVTDLEEGTMYLFRVTARNTAGVGKPSRSTCQITVKNPYDKPGAPGRPVITTVTTDSVSLEWTPADDKGDPVQNYSIEYRMPGSARWSSVDTNSRCVSDSVGNKSPSTFTISGLPSGSSYEFRVSAENRAGRGEESVLSKEVVTKEVITEVPAEYFCCNTHGGMAWKQRTDGCDPFGRKTNILDRQLSEMDLECEIPFHLTQEQSKLLADSWDRSHHCYSRKIQVRLYSRTQPEVAPNLPKVYMWVNKRHAVYNQSKWRFDITRDCVVTPWKQQVFKICPYDRAHWRRVASWCNVSVDIVKDSLEEDEKKTLLDVLRKRITHPQHTSELVKQQLKCDSENDIATTSLRISLTCPIGKMRMVDPCRSWGCKHLQCVDANTVISLNEKRLQWNCHLCNNPATFDSLRIDGLMAEILGEVPEHITDIEFREDGSWHYQSRKDASDPDVLELSNCVDMIDLTETDDEVSPQKKPLGVNTTLLNQATGTTHRADTSNNSRSGLLGAAPSTSGWSDSRFSSNSQSPGRSNSSQSNGRNTVLGTNYGQQANQSCHRHHNSGRNWSSRPYNRQDQSYRYESDWNRRYYGGSPGRSNNGYNNSGNNHRRYNGNPYNRSGYNSISGFFDRLGNWIGNHTGFRRPPHHSQ